ncbi:unnamed protein product, partial [Protopolystoma xenopodis]
MLLKCFFASKYSQQLQHAYIQFAAAALRDYPYLCFTVAYSVYRVILMDAYYPEHKYNTRSPRETITLTPDSSTRIKWSEVSIDQWSPTVSSFRPPKKRHSRQSKTISAFVEPKAKPKSLASDTLSFIASTEAPTSTSSSLACHSCR